jgi:hypothetical protein
VCLSRGETRGRGGGGGVKAHCRGGPQRHDAAGSRQWAYARMKVAMSGSIDDMPNKVNVLIPIVVMDRRKMIAATSRVCVTVHTEDLLERFVLSARCWTIR